MATTYGTHETSESNALLIKVVPRPETPLGEPKSDQFTTSRTVLGLIFLSLSYLVFLGHNILGEVRTRTAEAHIIPHLAKGKVFAVEGMSLFGDDDSGETQKFPDTTRSGDAIIVLIVSVQGDAAQELMASKVAEGAKSIGNTVVILETASTATFEQVLEADAVILGSSVENANTHPLMQSWINENWDMDYDLSSKIGAAFVTAGGISAGEEATMHSLTRAMLMFRMIVVGGDSWWSAFGASAITSESPFMVLNRKKSRLYFNEACYQHIDEVVHPMFLKKASGLGTRVATVAHQLQHC